MEDRAPRNFPRSERATVEKYLGIFVDAGNGRSYFRRAICIASRIASNAASSVGNIPKHAALERSASLKTVASGRAASMSLFLSGGGSALDDSDTVFRCGVEHV